MTRRTLQDPTASVRTRTSLASISVKAALKISRVLTATEELTLSLTSGINVYTVTVTGSVVGDAVIVSPTTDPDSSVGSWSGFVSEANTVTIRILVSGGPGGSAIQTFRVTVIGI